MTEQHGVLLLVHVQHHNIVSVNVNRLVGNHQLMVSGLFVLDPANVGVSDVQFVLPASQILATLRLMGVELK